MSLAVASYSSPSQSPTAAVGERADIHLTTPYDQFAATTSTAAAAAGHVVSSDDEAGLDSAPPYHPSDEPAPLYSSVISPSQQQQQQQQQRQQSTSTSSAAVPTQPPPVGAKPSLIITVQHNPVILYGDTSESTGATLRGALILSTGQAIKMRSLELRLRGVQILINDASFEMSKEEKKKFLTRIINLTKSPVIASAAGEGGTGGEIAPGNYTFPFEFQLPGTSPETINVAKGRIVYTLRATLARSGLLARNLVASHDVTVLRYTSDHTRLLRHLREVNKRKVLVPGVFLRGSVPQAAYGPGETINLTVQILGMDDEQIEKHRHKWESSSGSNSAHFFSGSSSGGGGGGVAAAVGGNGTSTSASNTKKIKSYRLRVELVQFVSYRTDQNLAGRGGDDDDYLFWSNAVIASTELPNISIPVGYSPYQTATNVGYDEMRCTLTVPEQTQSDSVSEGINVRHKVLIRAIDARSGVLIGTITPRASSTALSQGASRTGTNTSTSGVPHAIPASTTSSGQTVSSTDSVWKKMLGDAKEIGLGVPVAIMPTSFVGQLDVPPAYAGDVLHSATDAHGFPLDVKRRPEEDDDDEEDIDNDDDLTSNPNATPPKPEMSQVDSPPAKTPSPPPATAKPTTATLVEI
ncbi:hypothetical protein GQ42DRAFT_154888 [Ramicandelaber brevisporus]|nr:hypothetical protein GQ42DRAFT_154888 [Ramicandelaber brevisporus]